MLSHLFKWLLMLLAVAIWVSGSHSAGGASLDDGLYDAPIPDDAVFVRWLGVGSDQRVFGFRFPDTHIGSTYVAVSAQLLQGTRSGEYYSVLAQDGPAPIIIHEPQRPDPSKVYLLLVNASERAVKLVVAGKAIDVIGSTARHSSRAKAVNPVIVQLAVITADGSEVIGQFYVALRRGQNLTFFVHDDGVILLENRFGPVLVHAE